MIFLSLLSRKVNQFAGFLGLHTTGHHRGPTQGSYQKPAGKVNQIPTNPWHFPAENIDSTPILAVFPRESEPNPHESVALSPMVHTLQGTTGSPTQGNYRKTTGKVNPIPTNPWHFPAENIDSTPILAVFPRESEPYSHESWALSPMAHALPRLHSSTMHFPEQLKKLFEIFSKVLCDTIPASFRHFYRKIALLFSSKNGKKPARKHVSNF